MSDVEGCGRIPKNAGRVRLKIVTVAHRFNQISVPPRADTRNTITGVVEPIDQGE